MIETVQQKNARLRALREARDGDPVERAKQERHIKNLLLKVRDKAKIRSLVRDLERSMGERLPEHIRNKVF